METQLATTEKSFTKAVKFTAMVERAFKGQPGLKGYEGTLESVVRVQFAKMETQAYSWRKEVFKRLLYHLYAERCYSVLRVPDFIEVLANISVFGNKMTRQPESWSNNLLVPEEQLASLIRHCFAQYEVPEFMEHVFGGQNKIYMLWYVQLGRGDSVKDLSGFPVKLTKKAACFFRLVPVNYTIPQAIRRAQALGYGASLERAEGIAWSLLSEGFENEVFWETVIQFIAAIKEEITFDALQQVLEYLAQKYREDTAFSMKGRTWAALQRQSAEWHAYIAKLKDMADYKEWKPAEINDFEIRKGSSVFRIVQLTNSKTMYEEGYEMSHCVAEYVYDCMDEDCAIFSLRKESNIEQGFERLATIEVRPEYREIVQAKSKYNDCITEETADIILEWAVKESLFINYDEDLDEQPAFHAVQERERKNNFWIVWVIIQLVLFLLRMCAEE